ncbi:PIG-L deacetylase family protein [Tessaracoccus sp. MC1756]|uniref:PIG-L deacetylase family protein n=1 Tax=Tessaracoccus sp. MC1756 TaxID=2760311 RepID=UPI001601F6E1|nr:PIG-L family deacetylase [Tessaracoccus sp. MC1756]MBB1509610.1 PIG-L family deacetylase [Tessaracoccus sp. MC1756]
MTDLFPTSWNHAVVVVAHPDDPEYGIAAAVARWTREGKQVTYLLATSGEAGIQGMSPAEAGPLREEEQRRAAAHVGVSRLIWLDLPDGRLADTPGLADAIRHATESHPIDVVISTYRGPQWEPGMPNQADHMAVGEATIEALAGRNVWHFENGPGPTHHLVVTDDDVQAAVRSLAEHQVYLAVLDPTTDVWSQAEAVVNRSIDTAHGDNRVQFRLVSAPARDS